MLQAVYVHPRMLAARTGIRTQGAEYVDRWKLPRGYSLSTFLSVVQTRTIRIRCMHRRKRILWAIHACMYVNIMYLCTFTHCFLPSSKYVHEKLPGIRPVHKNFTKATNPKTRRQSCTEMIRQDTHAPVPVRVLAMII
jgi:hypothetical protein